MGNYTSCCYVKPQKAKLVDIHGNLRHIKVPITAAELMLEEPGYVISPADDLRRTCRFPAMRADEELSAGKVYLLVALGRVHSKVSESEMNIVESACKRKAKRRTSKVQPALSEGTDGQGEDLQIRVLGGNDTGVTGYRLGNYRQWKPVLEPISEGI